MANGMPAFVIVGLADKAVTEARERVRAALGALGLACQNLYLKLSENKITVVKIVISDKKINIFLKFKTSFSLKENTIVTRDNKNK